MTFIRKFNGKTERPNHSNRIVAVYTCPEHGEFDAEVQRDGRGEAPDVIACMVQLSFDTRDPSIRPGYCGLLCSWTPSPVAGRVRRIEAIKGKWEKPERETFLDTRDLAEGMDVEDWQAKRKKVWDRKREEDVMKIKRGELW